MIFWKWVSILLSSSSETSLVFPTPTIRLPILGSLWIFKDRKDQQFLISTLCFSLVEFLLLLPILMMDNHIGPEATLQKTWLMFSAQKYGPRPLANGIKSAKCNIVSNYWNGYRESLQRQRIQNILRLKMCVFFILLKARRVKKPLVRQKLWGNIKMVMALRSCEVRIE